MTISFKGIVVTIGYFYLVSLSFGFEIAYVWAAQPPAAPVTLTVPCSPAGGVPCSSGTNCTLGFMDCKTVIPQITTAIQNEINTEIQSIYQSGLDLDVPDSTPGNLVGRHIGTPVCNLVDGEVNKENASNDPSQPSCGNPKQFIVGGIDTTNGNGTLESAYLNGLYVAALKCYTTKYLSTINAASNILVQSYTAMATQTMNSFTRLMTDSSNVVCGLDPSCLSTLASLQLQTPSGGQSFEANPDSQNFVNIAQNLQKSATNNTNTSMAWCSDPTLSTKGNACNRVAICHLLSAESFLVADFEYIAYREITREAFKSWQTQLQNVQNQVQTQVEGKCSQSVSSSCKEKDAFAAPFFGYPLPKCLAQKMNQCYPSKYKKMMEPLSQQLYPNTGNCQ